MGLRGKWARTNASAKFRRRRWQMPGSDEYNAMIYGPPPEAWNDPNERRKIRRHWLAGGREAVMAAWDLPGLRPHAFWCHDVSNADLHRAEQTCECEAQAILFLGLADKKEKRAIIEGNEIEWQLAFIAKDRKLHPEDY